MTQRIPVAAQIEAVQLAILRLGQKKPLPMRLPEYELFIDRLHAAVETLRILENGGRK